MHPLFRTIPTYHFYFRFLSTVYANMWLTESHYANGADDIFSWYEGLAKPVHFKSCLGWKKMKAVHYKIAIWRTFALTHFLLINNVY